jgi:hypothetical protein
MSSEVAPKQTTKSEYLFPFTCLCKVLKMTNTTIKPKQWNPVYIYWYRVIKKSLCTWWLQYRKQVPRDFLFTPWVCIYTHIYIHTHYIHTYIHYIHTHTHTYIHTHKYTTYIHIHTTYTHTYIHTHIHTYTLHTYIHTYVYMYVRTYIHTYIHIHIHTYIHTYIHTHTHTHTQLSS